MNQRDFLAQYLATRDRIPQNRRTEFEQRFANRRKNPLIIFGFSYFFGFLAVDRFALGHVGLGLLKLFTLGGLFVWMIIDFFRVGGLAREINSDLLEELERDLTVGVLNSERVSDS